MKKLLLIFAILLIATVPAVMADTTSGANWDYELDEIGELLGHGHQYSNTQRAKRWQVGVGLDLIIHERSAEQNNLTPLIITSETRLDFNNKSGTQYFVATYRLSEVWKGIVDIIPGI